MHEIEEMEEKRELEEIDEMIRESERLPPTARQHKFTYEPLVRAKEAKVEEVTKRKHARRKQVLETHQKVQVEERKASETPEVAAKEEVEEKWVPQEPEAETMLEKEPQGFGEYLTTKLGLRKQQPTTVDPELEPTAQDAVEGVHDRSSAYEAKLAEETPKSEITPEASAAEGTAASITVKPEVVPEPEEVIGYAGDSSSPGYANITTTETAEPEVILDDATKPTVVEPEAELEQQDTVEGVLSSSSPAPETAQAQSIPKSGIASEDIVVPRLPKIFELEAAPKAQIVVPLLVDVARIASPKQAQIADEVKGPQFTMTRREKRALKQKEDIQAAKAKSEEKARKKLETKSKKEEKKEEKKEKRLSLLIDKEAEQPAEDAPLQPKQTPPAAEERPADETDSRSSESPAAFVSSQPISKEAERPAEDAPLQPNQTPPAAEKRPVDETDSRASSETPAAFASYTQFALSKIDGDTTLAKDLYAAEVLKFERMRDSFQKLLKTQEKRCQEQEVIIDRLATAKAALQDIEKWGDKFKPQAARKK